MLKAIAISLVIGALLTSYIEYKKSYNLYDLLKDKIFGLIASIKAKIFGLFGKRG